jgi:radical SAM superfamily enzyme
MASRPLASHNPFMRHHFEQGPIRPPSEAGSLLVRVSRNCPWNRCAFCSVYKGDRFSLRKTEEIVADLEAMRETFGDRVRSVFLQDANAMIARVDDLIEVLEAVRSRFPHVERITTYARSHTLARRSVEDLGRLREAGLDRVHVGFESGCDAVLEMVRKGTTRAEQIEGGKRVVEAGLELSEYWMPGLGGREHSAAHATDSASALREIDPHFIRLRTTAVVPGTALAEMRDGGDFVPLGEVELISEIRAFLDGLGDLPTRLESDHVLNLMMDLRGDLPADREHLLSLCDSFLEADDETQRLFILARRSGHGITLAHLEDDALRARLVDTYAELLDPSLDLDEVLNRARSAML